MKKLLVLSLVCVCFLAINPDILGLTIAVSLSVLFFLFYMAEIGWRLMMEKSVMSITIGEVRSRAYRAAGLKGAAICLSGNDGVGKTTQASLLKRNLEKMGLRTVVMWGRWPAFFSYAPIFLGKIVGLNKKVILSSYGAIRGVHEYQKMPPIAKLWSLSMLFDAIIFRFIKVNLMKLKYDVVILDRFLPDILSDIAYETGNSKICEELVGKAYLNAANSLAANLILDAPEAVAFSRKREVSTNEYQLKRMTYLKAGEGERSDIILATGHQLHTQEKILETLKNMFG